MLCKPQIVFIRDQIFNILGIEPPPVFYIGGSDTLPPPLERAAEEEAIKALQLGDEKARQQLIEQAKDPPLHVHRRAARWSCFGRLLTAAVRRGRKCVANGMALC